MSAAERLENVKRLELLGAIWKEQGGMASKLLEQLRWTCWQKRPNKKGDGFAKPPINPRTQRAIDVRSRANLITYTDALQAFKAGLCDGIGIATGNFDGILLCGIDVDHCIAEGIIIPEYREIGLKMIETGYMELYAAYGVTSLSELQPFAGGIINFSAFFHFNDSLFT